MIGFVLVVGSGNGNRMTARDLTRKIKEGWSERARLKQEKHESRIGSSFHAREFGGCQLRAYLRRLGYPETESRPQSAGRLADLADRGEHLEQSTLDSLSLSEPSLYAERQERGSRTYSAGGVSFECVGRLDGRLSSDTGIECKSVGTEHYKELRSIDNLHRLRPAWINQCHAYCWIFDLSRVFVVCIDRNDHLYRTFEVKRDKKREKGLLEELAQTEKAIKEKDPPNPKISLGCYVCPYHPYCPAFGGDPETPYPPSIPADSNEEVRQAS